MISVTIELISAITGETSMLGRMYIANDGTGTKDRGDYIAAVCRKGSSVPPAELYPNGVNLPKASRIGTVKDYPRLSYNVWRLIARACLATFPEEREPKGIRHVLNKPVVKGIAQFMMRAMKALGEQPGKTVEEVLTPEEVSVFEWMQAGLADE